MNKFFATLKTLCMLAPEYRVVKKHNGLYYAQQYMHYSMRQGPIYHDISLLTRGSNACQTLEEAQHIIDTRISVAKKLKRDEEEAARIEVVKETYV